MDSDRTLHLHETRAGNKRPFEPIDPNRVTIYLCGPTVYNYVHIGNARPPVVFDVLRRVLEVLYPEVVFASNFTDIDDRINAAAQQQQVPIDAVTGRYIDAYDEDMAALGVQRPTVQPRATHSIAEIIDNIEGLIATGHAYAAEGHVLFHVPSDAQYGQLSRRSVEDMLDGARVDVAPYKRDPKDFVLWKPSSDDLPGWDSPWGRGRPGWHIECSAMIRAHLGATIDIHGGGSDLVFPHHENELAQGTCLGDHAEFVRYWVHNGMLTLASEKMSKSVGNVHQVRDLLSEHDGEVLRYALLSGHYRQTLAWTPDLINQARASLDRLYRALGEVSPDSIGSATGDEPFACAPAVWSALLDDLNTPRALAGLHGLAAEINRGDDPEQARQQASLLVSSARLLGLLDRSPQEWFQRAGQDKGSLSAEEIEGLIAERTAARKDRNFQRADDIRDQLAEAGVELEDGRDGTRWRRV